MSKNRRKKYLLWIMIFLLVFFVLPNLINFREQTFFSEKRRLEAAKAATENIGDSIQVAPGEYYKRGGLHVFFFGEKNRRMWALPIDVPILNLDTAFGGLAPYAIGGSQQTISVKLEDTTGRHWVLRSVNKDQKNALPRFLQFSALRFMFRDQVAAMNPYAPQIASALSQTVGLPHLNPTMYWIPYNAKYGKYNTKIAGRLVYLEENLDTTWHSSPAFGNPINILDTDDMEKLQRNAKTAIDTLVYLKSRLFDMFIGDWDRHEGQWRWALVDSAGEKRFIPIAKDRDMAMYLFDEGVVSHITLAINHKFQSFRKKINSVPGLMKQSKTMDRNILKGVPIEKFFQISREIQQSLNAGSIRKALQLYPAHIYPQVADDHFDTFISRLQQLPSVAEEFHRLLND